MIRRGQVKADRSGVFRFSGGSFYRGCQLFSFFSGQGFNGKVRGNSGAEADFPGQYFAESVKDGKQPLLNRHAGTGRALEKVLQSSAVNWKKSRRRFPSGSS